MYYFQCSISDIDGFYKMLYIISLQENVVLGTFRSNINLKEVIVGFYFPPQTLTLYISPSQRDPRNGYNLLANCRDIDGQSHCPVTTISEVSGIG